MSAVGLAVSDPATGVTCELAASRQFDSASIVKATILAALLHGDNAQPSAGERAHATAMITESDNDAATDLWNDVGPAAMRQFLNLAKMTQTVPGTGGYWGLTQVTARDQMKLLHLLTAPNGVLSRAARSYELGLMARVDPAQRWGISAGAPAGMTVALKNGWLPTGAAGWQINSIGCVLGSRPPRAPGAREYCLVVLTDDNPTMAYGVETVSEVARVVNTELNSPLATAVPGAAPASRPPRHRPCLQHRQCPRHHQPRRPLIPHPGRADGGAGAIGWPGTDGAAGRYPAGPARRARPAGPCWRARPAVDRDRGGRHRPGAAGRRRPRCGPGAPGGSGRAKPASWASR